MLPHFGPTSGHGVIQQSAPLRHGIFSEEFSRPTTTCSCTDATSFPTMRTPPGPEIEDIKGPILLFDQRPLDSYRAASLQDNGSLSIMGNIAEPGKSLEAIRSLPRVWLIME